MCQHAIPFDRFCVAFSCSITSNDAYKSATIALAVIAGIAIVIIVLLVLYVVWKIIPNNGLYAVYCVE